jgi:hypothetical protein
VTDAPLRVASNALLCPSARCEPGATLLGVVRSDATIGHLPQTYIVDEEFAQAANADGLAETRFRFASACVKGNCSQWNGSSCGVVAQAADELALRHSPVMPNCSIRPQCRWFAERAADACRVCHFVVTDDEQASRNYRSGSR